MHFINPFILILLHFSYPFPSFIVFQETLIIFFSFTEHYYFQSNFQKDSLHKVRSIIDHGSYNYLIRMRLTNVFIEYHKQPENSRLMFGKLFKKMYLDDSTETEYYKTWASDGVNVYISTLTDEEVVIIGSHAFTKGKSPVFQNHGGQTGMIEVRGVLNEKGVKYEIQN